MVSVAYSDVVPFGQKVQSGIPVNQELYSWYEPVHLKGTDLYQIVRHTVYEFQGELVRSKQCIGSFVEGELESYRKISTLL